MTDDDDVQRSRRFVVDEDLTREQFEALFPPQFAYAYEPLFADDFRPAGVRQVLAITGQFLLLDTETGRFVSRERVLGRQRERKEEEEEEVSEEEDEEQEAAASET